jgi:hypothetical protein
MAAGATKTASAQHLIAAAWTSIAARCCECVGLVGQVRAIGQSEWVAKDIFVRCVGMKQEQILGISEHIT